MTTYIQYEIAGGEIIATGTSDTDVLPFVVLDGNAVLEGYGINSAQYVANGVIVNYTTEQQIAKLQKPTYLCAWSNTTFTWVDTRTTEQQNIDASNSAIAQRDFLLSQSDWIVVFAVY
jgi:hypothetical protein